MLSSRRAFSYYPLTNYSPNYYYIIPRYKHGGFMKKIIALILTLIVFGSLAACDEESQNNATPAHFVGKVIEIYENGYLLEVTDEGNYGHLALGTTVQVNINTDDTTEYELGDNLKVVFDGTISKSYPPQVLHVISIEKAEATETGD